MLGGLVGVGVRNKIDGVVNELAEAGSPIIFANATHSCQILKIEKIAYFKPRKAARVAS